MAPATTRAVSTASSTAASSRRRAGRQQSTRRQPQDAAVAAGLTAVLFALDREARRFRRGARRLPGIAPCPVWQKADGTVVVVTGMGAAAVELALDWLLEDWRYRPTRIVSAGFCGGLSPEELQVGSLVRPAEVVDEAGHRWSLSDAPAGVRLVSISACGARRGGPTDLAGAKRCQRRRHGDGDGCRPLSECRASLSGPAGGFRRRERTAAAGDERPAGGRSAAAGGAGP